MTTIVLNTMTGAVTEYDWAFQSITPTHAGDATGLYALGGDLDDALPIAAKITTSRQLWGQTLKKFIGMVYLSMAGEGSARLTVHGAVAFWLYEFVLRATGQTRCPVGRGIRENYLGFTVENVEGNAFTLDRIEVQDIASKQRRV